jgi:SAM-dependent methyltransferase
VRRLAKLYRSLVRMPEIAATLDRIEREMSSLRVGPVERHVLLSAVGSETGLFHRSYDAWRVARIDAILELYGIDFLRDARILELGAGHADIGAFLADLGAQVLCLDGRSRNVTLARLKHRDVPRLECRQADLMEDFRDAGRFDLVIDMGLLYHVTNVEEHLRWVFAMTDEVVLETAVCDSTDPELVLLVEEDPGVDEDALRGLGSRPSPFLVERVARESGFSVQRHFSPTLNTGPQFRYDWEHRDDGRAPADMSLRRFWRFSRARA